jgi:hypothetical protein
MESPPRPESDGALLFPELEFSIEKVEVRATRRVLECTWTYQAPRWGKTVIPTRRLHKKYCERMGVDWRSCSSRRNGDHIHIIGHEAEEELTRILTEQIEKS